MAWKKSSRKKAVTHRHKAAARAKDIHVKARTEHLRTVNAPKKIW